MRRWLAGRQTQDSVRATLAKMGNPIGASYYSELESGAKPVNEEWRAVFTRLWGESADEWTDPWEKPPDTSDAAAVLRAIERQTEMLERQWEVSTALVQTLTSLVEEMRASRDESIGRDNALVRLLARLEVAVTPASTPDEGEPQRLPDAPSTTNGH